MIKVVYTLFFAFSINHKIGGFHILLLSSNSDKSSGFQLAVSLQSLFYVYPIRILYFLVLIDGVIIITLHN